MKIAVYLGSRNGARPEYVQAARSLGAWIGDKGHTLVYGGSRGGLMGELASAVLNHGGKVTGVLPDVDEIMNLRQKGLTEYIYTKDVAERRSKMIELADAFAVLPGGLGTLDEITEVLSLKSLNLIPQPIVFFDAADYFAPLRALFRHMIGEGFSEEAYFENVLFTDDTTQLDAFLR